MRKPFYLKYKLLNQTKTNLWELESNALKHKLKKKKWNFLKQASSKQPLTVFQFSPFVRNFSKQRIKGFFKNNLASRKLVRLKYSRLKNKDLYRYFKDDYRYKKLLLKLGHRLDVNLSFILGSFSIFSLRQKILHQKISLNGQKVRSPGISLKPFDIISFKLSDISLDNFLYKNFVEKSKFLEWAGYKLFSFSSFSSLTQDSQKQFIKDIALLLAPDDSEIVEEFFIEQFKVWVHEGVSVINFSKDSKSKVLNLENFIKNLKLLYLKEKQLNFLQQYKKRLFLNNVASTDNNFFVNNFNPAVFEFFITGDYLDIVFLGVVEGDIILSSNEKYLLHYLYK